AYVRGGEPNSDKEIPNPTSDPAGAHRQICAVNTHTGRVVVVGEGESPLFSPHSDRGIFTTQGPLLSPPLPMPAQRAAAPASKLFEIRGEVESAAWSPDGTLLAFVSARGDHSFIGLFDPAQKRIRFLEPGIDRDVAPRWSPDGRAIAYLRLFN